MAKWFSPDPDYSDMTESDFVTRQLITNILEKYTREMENYSYFGSNPGVSTDDYEDVADLIMDEFKLWENVSE